MSLVLSNSSKLTWKGGRDLDAMTSRSCRAYTHMPRLPADLSFLCERRATRSTLRWQILLYGAMTAMCGPSI